MVKRLSLSLFFTLLYSSITLALSPEEHGLAIAQEQDKRNSGWIDNTVDVTMILQRRNGKKSNREFRLKLLETQNNGDKSLIIFDRPKDVRGTAFLNYSYAMKPDDQWLYLPALRRVKRIASRNKTGRFMGSEFTYEDMSSFQVEKYDYKFIREDTINENPVYVVESIPKDKYSGYSRLISYIDKTKYIVHKIEFYNQKGNKLKTLTVNGYHQYAEKYWRADTSTMTNHKTSQKTDLLFKNHLFGLKLKASEFKQSALDRGR